MYQQAWYKDEPTTIAAFMRDKSFTRYLSNVKNDAFKPLEQQIASQFSSKMEYFSSISKLMTAAQKDLPPDQFKLELKQLVHTYWQDMDISELLGDMQLGSSTRYSSPKRKHKEDAGAPR